MGNSRLHYGKLSELIGQESNISQLQRFIEFFKATNSTPGHILLIGEEGNGQSTIADTLANELDVGFQRADAARVEILGDLTALVTNVRPKQILFGERIHQLRKPLDERLCLILRERKLDFLIGQGPAQRKHIFEIPDFTLVATCPSRVDCPSNLLAEFSLVLTLQPYSLLELQEIAQKIAEKSGITLDGNAAALLAMNCDRRPRHLDQLLQRFARAINKQNISEEDIRNAFQAFGIPTKGNRAPNGSFDLQSLSGQDFEHLITALLSRMGFQAEMTKTSGDGGIDIVAAFDRPIFGGWYLFQCKRFAPDNLVGAPTVRDFFGAVMAERAVKGIFVTTSDFTSQAQEFAQKAGVELINSHELSKLLTEYGLMNGSAQ